MTKFFIIAAQEQVKTALFDAKFFYTPMSFINIVDGALIKQGNNL